MLDSSVRNKALKLRVKGASYTEISKELRVAKSTLSLWLRDVVLSKKAQKRLQGRVSQGLQNGLIKRNKNQTHLAQKRAREIRARAQKTIRPLSQERLLLIGVALYWAEGYKRPAVRNGKERTWHPISFVNADPEMITVFISFLRKILHVDVDDIRAVMRLYPHINESKAQEFWMSASGLPKHCFRKSTFLVSRASQGKKPYNRLPYGTLQINVYNTEKFHYLMGLIEGVKKKYYRDILVGTPG